MYHKARGTSSLRLARSFAPSCCLRSYGAGSVARRLAGGCLIPRPDDIVHSAVRALQQQADAVQPAILLSVDRSSKLAVRRDRNAVPEGAIVDAIIADKQRDYFRLYATAARRSLLDSGASSAAVWRGVLARYWKHLQAVVPGGLEVPESNPGDYDPSLAILLRPTIQAKLLAREPFKHRTQNNQYNATTTELREALHRLQQYLFFMRPDDPASPSVDTALRIEEILACVCALYQWAQWMMWTTDARVCKRLDPEGLRACRPGRAPAPPILVFTQHLQEGPVATNGSTQCMALTAAVASVLGCLRRISQLWETSKWASGAGGTGEAVVAAVESVSLVHHSAQYALNAVLAGYVTWATDGLHNRRLAAALRQQELFCRDTSPLFPTMTSFSWAAMEQTMEPWFRAALARSLLGNAPLPRHYRGVLDSLPPSSHTETSPADRDAPAESRPDRGSLVRCLPEERYADSDADLGDQPLSRRNSAPVLRHRRRTTLARRTVRATPSVSEALAALTLSEDRTLVDGAGSDRQWPEEARSAAVTAPYYMHMGACAPPLPPRNPSDAEWDPDAHPASPATAPVRRRSPPSPSRWPCAGARPRTSDSPEAPATDSDPKARRAARESSVSDDDRAYVSRAQELEDAYFEAPVDGDAAVEAHVYETGDDATEHVYEECDEPTDPLVRRTSASTHRNYVNALELRSWIHSPSAPIPATIPPMTEEEEDAAEAWELFARQARRRFQDRSRRPDTPPTPPFRRTRTRALDPRGPTNLAALSAVLTKAQRQASSRALPPGDRTAHPLPDVPPSV
ncbi:tegument protein VP11/12 [Saimiriine alphaherpesvirus 1]|uniref:Tegument protein VP11/12 n=1 Tax=Saimiriine herpesvirus 1 (strain MV-5-4-PSL) TaxID=10353 RepID=E2IUC4_SHV1|nr:tegument protein VP11/12 [Saimiriine alphaherpesvirus 1]ADO13782.1 tegument protein VP11/12 [Saimiriine alphaherpesvirus 1]